LDIGLGDVSVAKLTACQKDAAAGKYAGAMAGFIQHVARDYESIKLKLRAESLELRNRVLASGQHARTPENVANLAVGFRFFLTFATEAGALTKDEANQIWMRGWKAVGEAAKAQDGPQHDAEPTGKFLRLIAAALASGRAHIAAEQGNVPDERPEAWGWRPNSNGHDAQGKRIGWIKDGIVYLEPDAAFAEAQELAAKQGESLPIAPRTLWKRMKEKRLLSAFDGTRERLTVRRTLQGAQHEVIAVGKDTFSLDSTVQTVHSAQNTAEIPQEMDTPNGRSNDRVDGTPTQPSNGVVQKEGHLSANGQFGQSDTGKPWEPTIEEEAAICRTIEKDRGVPAGSARLYTPQQFRQLLSEERPFKTGTPIDRRKNDRRSQEDVLETDATSN
jgi:hypothetical protein